MPAKINISGKRFGRLTALSESTIVKGHRNYNFLCDCGKTKEIRKGDVTRGQVRSCGCLADEIRVMIRVQHGMCGTPEYGAWQQMINRCTNPKYENFHRYGGRGISVCEQWMSFKNFHADMGMRPKGMTLDRRDNNGNYEPNNCRWATRREQMNNTRRNVFIEHDGKRLTPRQWSIELGIPIKLISGRMRSGLTASEILDPKQRGQRFIEFNGKNQTLSEWARERSTTPQILWNRLNQGWSVERTLTEPAQRRNQ